VLQNGALVLVVKYGRDVKEKADKFRVALAPEQRLDNSTWHDVYVLRRNQQVYVNFSSLLDCCSIL